MKLTDQQTAYFCRSLALLLHGGISPAEGFSLLAGEGQKDLPSLPAQMGEALDRGDPLSEAMAESGSFEDYVSGFVRVGEETGALEQALDALADHYETRHRIRQALRRAVAWPLMLLGLMLVVIWVLLAQVLPVFDRVYASFGGGLTGPAAVLLALGQQWQLWLCLLLGAAVLAVWTVKRLARKDRGIRARFCNARYLQAAAMGLCCGLSEEEALALAGGLLKDAPGTRQRCEDCEEQLRQGVSLPEALKAGRFLEASACRLLAAGQRSGNADRVLTQIAQRQMEGAFAALEAAAGWVEPLLVLGASALVGGILLTVMLPLMDILSAMG